MAYWTLSSTFAGFTEVQAANQTIALSTTAQTIVDIGIDGPSTTNASNAALTPTTLAISGGFRVCDTVTGAVTNIGALVAQSTSDPARPTTWFIRLIFPAQPSAVSVLIKAWGIFAVYSGGTN